MRKERRKERGLDSPEFIGTEVVESRLGNFSFEGGYPTRDAARDLFEWRKYFRIIEAFQENIPAMSMWQLRKGQEVFSAEDSNGGTINGTEPNVVLRLHELMDSRALFLTPNTDTVYAYTFLDLKAWGPTVVEAPPNMLGTFNDMWMRFIEDVGGPGPDQGAGGRFLIYPPGCGPVGHPDEKNYYTAQSRTYGVWLILRSKIASMDDDDIKVASDRYNDLKIYPYGKKDSYQTHLVDISRQEINTIHSDDIEFFMDLDQLIQEEAPNAISDLERFHLASIGIKPGSSPNFDNPETKALFTEAARVAGAMARANSYASPDMAKFIYEDKRQWLTPFIGGDENFASEGYLDIDRRANFSYIATVCTPAMTKKMVNTGSQYLLALKDGEGQYLRAKDTYTLRVPLKVPCVDFWSLVVYDASSRSMLKRKGSEIEVEDHQMNDAPSLNSYSLYPKDDQGNSTEPDDGTCFIYFGPERPTTINSNMPINWINTTQLISDADDQKGICVIFRLYGPTEEYFKFGTDEAWSLPEVEKGYILPK